MRFSLTVTDNVNNTIVAIAKVKGLSKNKIINDACWQYVESFEAKHGKINTKEKTLSP